jgi:hypothetical protein
VIFLQVQPHLITNLKLVWNLMLVVSLLVLGISLLKDVNELVVGGVISIQKFGLLDLPWFECGRTW